jgi:PAS domain S-box-containing protein
LLGNRLRIELVFFAGTSGSSSSDPQMTPVAAICFLLVGVTLALYGLMGDPGRRRIRWALIPVAILAAYVLVGIVYGGRVFMSGAHFRPMALHAAVSFLALCTGLAALPPTVEPISSLTLPGSAGYSARRLFPAILVIPFLLGWVRILGERAGWFDPGFGTAGLTTVSSVILMLLVYFSVRYVQRTERLQTTLAETVKDSEKRIFRLLHGLPTGIFVVDPEGRPYYANRKSGEILGRGTLPDARPEELPERYQVYRAGTNETLPPDRIPVLRALKGEEVYSTEVEIHRPDRVVPLEVWASPIRNKKGELEFAVAAFNDITERNEAARRIEELNGELQRQLAELDAVNRELETFSYSVSHDLRAPLRAVDGFSRMLAEDHAAALSPEAHRLLERIRSNIRRMGLLIDDLLRFSRMSRKELETSPVDMTTLARAAADDLARSREHQARITIGELPRAEGDLELLRQVWLNLIDNGLKYSGKQHEPRIEIGGSRNGNDATYWVRDNGVGFDMTYAGKLFGVFQRLHSQDEFEGTGVGLAIVQRIIHRHGGRVWAEGAPDRGATFSFTLPLGDLHA